MAKWGEGDPRWIVEERPDATNVNNWHWTEKNACVWSQDKLKDLLVGLKIDSNVGLCFLTDMDKIEGEAVANNRKGKLIFFYEWDLTLTWKGRLHAGEKEVEGKVHIPNLSEENDLEEIEVNITVKEPSTEADILKEFLYHKGREKVREQLGVYVAALKEEFSKGMILPKNEGKEESEEGKKVVKEAQISLLSSGFNDKMKMNITNNKAKEVKVGKLDTANLNLNESFQCMGADFYRAMITPEMVMAFTNGPAKLEPKKGGQFELFGGNIHGDFVELVPDKRIVQRWRMKRWPADHYSTVTFDIDQQEDHTVVKLKQTGIPYSDEDGTRENWKRYYWDSIKRTFGWGSFL